MKRITFMASALLVICLLTSPVDAGDQLSGDPGTGQPYACIPGDYHQPHMVKAFDPPPPQIDYIVWKTGYYLWDDALDKYVKFTGEYVEFFHLYDDLWVYTKHLSDGTQQEYGIAIGPPPRP